jgi:hypothetical protein
MRYAPVLSLQNFHVRVGAESLLQMQMHALARLGPLQHRFPARWPSIMLLDSRA